MKYLKKITIGVLAVLFMMFISIDIGTQHVLEFGKEVKAATINYRYDQYSIIKDPYPTDYIWYVSDSGPIGVNRDSLYFTLANKQLIYGFGIQTWDLTELYQTYTNIEISNQRSRDGYNDSDGTHHDPSAYCALRGTKFTQGALIKTNIVAPDGTYPDNGLFSDGYWYVKKGIANQNPTITPSTQGNETFSASAHSAKEVA